MNRKVIMVNVANDLRDKINKYPFGNLFVRDCVFKVFPNEGVIGLQNLDKFENHGENLLSFFVLEIGVGVEIKNFDAKDQLLYELGSHHFDVIVILVQRLFNLLYLELTPDYR
jgi:hypothetical protein